MLYREAGQYKTTYAADMAIFPIRQDRVALALLLLFAFAGIPLMAMFHIWPFGSDYLLRAILIPFLILALAAIGLNILIGYCGQISLGGGAFMAIGAYSAYKFGTGVYIPLAWFGTAAFHTQADIVLGRSLYSDRLVHGFDLSVFGSRHPP